MIDSLRKKMIWVCGSAVVVVFALIFLAISFFGTRLLTHNMDMMTQRIAEGSGAFRPFDQNHPKPPEMKRHPDFFSEEIPFSTRYFTVWIGDDGEITGVNLDSISTVDAGEAASLAQKALALAKNRDWLGKYRFRVFTCAQGRGIVFVDGGTNRAMTRTLILTSAAVLVGSMLLILAVLVVVSKRVVRPIAQSYEKQKQFVTDANHELKTPLTLILTNLDIVEQELGRNEWLEDIRIESQRMSNLVGQLTALSRLDEEEAVLPMEEFSFSDICSDTAAEFEPLIASRNLSLRAAIGPGMTVRGEEAAIRRLVAILKDNAVKYCDPGGEISLFASSRRQTELRLENTCAAVGKMDLDRLFDRFYREDRARTPGASFGIGLSLARAIVQKHKGDIKAYQAGPDRIGFRVTLK